MINFREVNDNVILKNLFINREQDVFSSLSAKDKKHVKKQLDKFNENFMDYLCYSNEKYYRNGFVDGFLLAIECLDT